MAGVPLPDWLLWLLPVPLATGFAIGWVSWRTRVRGPQRPDESVQDYARFRAALAAPPREQPRRDKSAGGRTHEMGSSPPL